jgi:chromosome segregation ATPase
LTAENGINELSDEKKEILDVAMEKLEEMIITNESLEAENDELQAKLDNVQQQLDEIEQKSIGNGESVEKLEKETKMMKEKVGKLEDENETLKQEKLKAEEILAELKKKYVELDAENGTMRKKFADIGKEWEKIVDENICLKLDLEDTKKEVEKVNRKLSEAFEDKITSAQNNDKTVTNRSLVPSNGQALNPHHMHQIQVLNNQLHFMNQQYGAVCHERDALRTHLDANQQ